VSKICDSTLFKEVCRLGEELKNERIVEIYQKDGQELAYPLDHTVLEKLNTIQQKGLGHGEDELTYEANDEIDELWSLLIERSIICLRFFDKREPFMKNGKRQYVLGLDKLKKYHENYTAFEGVLYGSDAYYRDHVFHVVRVWLLGVYLLLNKNTHLTGGNGRLIDQVHFEGERVYKTRVAEQDDIEKTEAFMCENAEDGGVDGEERETERIGSERAGECLVVEKENKQYKVCERVDGTEAPKYLLASIKTFSSEINILEKLSMWTVAALCHDLGYPLEKSKNVLEKTEKMMEAFVSNPYVEKNFKFDGTQDSNNLDIITFMSKKMKPVVEKMEGTDQIIAQYKASIQDKYRFKYKLSLEDFSHGIVSAIIVYKMLIYFIETDNNPDADYIFANEDARQFYIRRDILRAISSHTCENIYHIDVLTLPMILFACDELQEWGRKSWKSMYQGAVNKSTELTVKEFHANRIDYVETVHMENANAKQLADNVERIIKKQYILYLTTFRDGQYTARRSFELSKCLHLEINKDYRSIERIEIIFSINSGSDPSKFELDIRNSGDEDSEEMKKTVDMLREDLKKLVDSYRKRNNCGEFHFLIDGEEQK
jgi:hypothetical protein